MKNFILLSLLSLGFFFSCHGVADGELVYTIGAYDEVFAKHASVTKLGPLPASQVPPEFPKSFLEKDGSYGGGEASRTIKQACDMLHQLLASGVLPPDQSWHIYLLDAEWGRDTYQLHPNNFRINRSVQVLRMVKENCF